MKPLSMQEIPMHSEFEIRAAKDREKPIEDSDGVVEGEYAFRLTPEDTHLRRYLD